MSEQYRVDDRSMLGEPPWQPSDPALKAWEKAHGHDVRLDCDLTAACFVMIDAYEAAIKALELFQASYLAGYPAGAVMAAEAYSAAHFALQRLRAEAVTA